MKNFKPKQKTIQLIGYSLTIGFILLLLIKGTLDFAQWHSEYQFNIQNIFKIEPREKPVVHVHLKEAQAKEPTIEEYICSFAWDCKTALAVARAESGMHCDAQNINKGTNSLDLGIMQINSVHLKKGWKVAQLLDCKTNVQLAYEIYQGSGWSAWSTINNGSYKKF